MEHYRIQAIKSFADLEAVRPFWEKAMWHRGAEFEFFKLVVQSRRDILSPCVLTVWKQNELVALWVGRMEKAKLALAVGYIRLARIPIRQLVLLEGGLMGEVTEEILELLLRFVNDLLKQENLSRAVLEQLRLDSPEYRTTQAVFNRAQLCPAHALLPHYLLRFPKTWEEFLKSRSKKHRYWLKRLPSVLDKEFNANWAIRKYTTAAEARQFLEAAEVVAQGTYQRALGVGLCRNEETTHRLELEANRGELRGYVLFIANEPKAFWYCTVVHRTLYLAATGYVPACRRYELGTILLMKLFEEHCGTQAEVVDFGLGDAGYKKRFANENFWQKSLYVFPKSWRGFSLNALQSTVFVCEGMARWVLDRFHLTQFLKTVWRRKMTREVEQPSNLSDVNTPGEQPTAQ